MATRLRKNIKSRWTSEHTGWAARLRENRKKGERVRVAKKERIQQ